ncbi:MAG: hypothetical protein K6G26_05840, partial [Lachnospiraceae bacterium]|nr:hypothetical protein [Lachnospiraceae bacterium]
GSLRSIFNDYKLQNKVFYNYLRPVIIILIIVCITVMTCLQIVNSYVKISELGILYAFGIKKICYLFLFLMQNGFTTIISFIFSGFISNTFLNNMYVNETGYDSISVNDIYFPYTLPKVLLVGIIIVTASSFITYMIMRRYTAREMISNNI